MRLARALTIAVCILLTLTSFLTGAFAATEKVLYSFMGREDGALPASGVIFDKSGNLYGVASAGGNPTCFIGALGCGVVFELSPNSNGWTETVLYTFQGGFDGAVPSSLTFDAHGDLVGVTAQGGGTGCVQNIGCGTVFKLAQRNGNWTESVLYRFQGGTDGWTPSNVLPGPDGNLYGATWYGGDPTCGYNNFGCGVIFEVTHRSGVWKETVLHRFGATTGDGIGPNPGLVFDTSGNLYGSTTESAYPVGYGTVFELMPRGDGSWQENLYTFGGDSGVPIGGVIWDRFGNLYGPQFNGGLYAWGDVFQLSRNPKSGPHVKEKIVWNFGGPNINAVQPNGGLVFDAQGNLYGPTEFSINNLDCYCGSVFKLTQTQGRNSVSESMLYVFTGGSDGGYPLGNLTVDSAENIYGVTYAGGTGDCVSGQGYGCGVVYEISQ